MSEFNSINVVMFDLEDVQKLLKFLDQVCCTGSYDLDIFRGTIKEFELHINDFSETYPKATLSYKWDDEYPSVWRVHIQLKKSKKCKCCGQEQTETYAIPYHCYPEFSSAYDIWHKLFDAKKQIRSSQEIKEILERHNYINPKKPA